MVASVVARRSGRHPPARTSIAVVFGFEFGAPGEFFFHYTKSDTAFGAILRTDDSAPQLRLSPYRLMDDPYESKDWMIGTTGWVGEDDDLAHRRSYRTA